MSPRRLYELDRSSNQFPDQLYRLLHDKEYVEYLQRLPDDELPQLVDHLDDVLGHLDCAGQPFGKSFHVLQKICGLRATLPATYQLSGVLSFTSEVPVAFGGSCDAYRGTLSTGAGVCIKRIRMCATDDMEKIKQSFCKEAVMWKHLSHPHVVPFVGITLEPLQLVSGWMPRGELRSYVKENPQANLISLLLGVAEGLAYLHSCNVIHGDLKGPNIMVDESSNARITDFGLASIVRDPHSMRSNLGGDWYTTRWCAPEILMDEQPASKGSDIFSFGMVIIEVFTGKAPFVGSTAPAVIASVTSGKRPERPNHASFTDCLWELTQKCWEQTPSDRPSAEQALEVLKKLADKTAFTSPIPVEWSLEQEAVPTNSPAISSTPLVHNILPKARVDGGGTVSPDQAYAQPAQTLGGRTNHTSSLIGPPFPGRTRTGRLIKPPEGSPEDRHHVIGQLNNEKNSHNPQHLDELSNNSGEADKVSLQWHDINHEEFISVPIQHQPQSSTKKRGLWYRIRRFICCAQ